jgi:hypothetical protein
MSVAVLCLPALLLAQQADSNQITPEEFMAKLAARSGTVVISNGLATLQVPPTFRYMWVGILAFKKLIVAAVGVWMRRVFGKKDSPQASAPPPTTA